MKLENKVAVVTGGASGIGSAICEAFARNGAIVTVADVDEPGARQLAGRLERAIAQVCDVTDPVAVDRAVDQVVADHGRLDILVNNAGIAGADELVAGVERGLAQLGEMATGRVTTAIDVVRNLTDQQWRLMLATHLDGTFFCTRAALRHMVP
jgi:3-oxoacyl-[acyl-carrier protein] reductase